LAKNITTVTKALSQKYSNFSWSKCTGKNMANCQKCNSWYKSSPEVPNLGYTYP